MTGRIAIIQGHPDPSGGRLCHALARSYADGAREAGAEVRTIEVARLDFPLLRTQDEWLKGEDGAPDAIKPTIEDCRWADHLMIVYPLWLGTMPALLKAYLEQAFRPGVALKYGDNGFPEPMFKGKSARVAITMGMPTPAYRWYYGAHSLKSLERNVLQFTGVKPIRESLFGMVATTPRPKNEERIRKFQTTGRRDAASIEPSASGRG